MIAGVCFSSVQIFVLVLVLMKFQTCNTCADIVYSLCDILQ